MDGMNAGKKRFWAHSGEVWQPLAEHLENVASLARRLVFALARGRGLRQPGFGQMPATKVKRPRARAGGAIAGAVFAAWLRARFRLVIAMRDSPIPRREIIGRGRAR